MNEPRDVPRLIISVPLEGPAELHPAWQTAEDAARLREHLLSRPGLPDEIAELLDRGIPEIRSRRGGEQR
jgi:hypothetical protein